MGADGAGEAGEAGAEGEGDEFDAEAVDAHGGGGGLVLADGDPGAADAGVGGAGEDEHHETAMTQHQQVVVGEAAEGEAADVVPVAEVEPETSGRGCWRCRWGRW